MKQARATCWRKWAAKHECEELKDCIWLEPALALLRRKTKEEWTDMDRHVARKLVLEGGWVQKRLFDIGWSNESKCQACHRKEGTEKHRLCFVQDGMKSGAKSQRPAESGNKKSENGGEGVEVAERCCHASSQ